MKPKMVLPAVTALWIVTLNLPAQPLAYTVLSSFGPLERNISLSSAQIIASGDTLYGTSSPGFPKLGSQIPLDEDGMVFSISPDGTGFQVLHSFPSNLGTYTNGAFPGGLVLSGDTLYGETALGGSSLGVRLWPGALFSVHTNGTGFTIMHSFSPSSYDTHSLATNADGVAPRSLMVVSGGKLYGSTSAGGPTGLGTVFSINTDGTGFSVIYDYGLSGLTLTGNTIYGTSADAVTKVNTDGTGASVIWQDSGQLGPNFGSMILIGNRLYGTSLSGGIHGVGSVYSLNTDGTGFAVLHNFNLTDGAELEGGLTLVGKTLYGTTAVGGSNSDGTIFSLNTDGTGFSVLYNFGPVGFDSKNFVSTNADGGQPGASMVYAGNALFGTTKWGGDYGRGTLFSLAVSAPPTIVISQIVHNPNGTVTLDFVGVPNSTNVVWATSTLTPPWSWQPIATNVAGANGKWQTTDSSAIGMGSRFYRAAVP